MNPVRLEIFLDDKTLAGMKSVEGSFAAMEAVTRQVIERLKLQLTDLEKQYKLLQKQGLASDKELADIQALQGSIGGLKEQLKELEAQKKKTNETPLMRDDPAPKLNNVKMSMQQIARELPALSMGPQMFFLAISNNIPMFTDAVASARKEYELLMAAGKKATPIWKQLLTSLVSWQTAMATVITLSVVYGKEIGEWVKGLFKAKSAMLELLSAEQEMALSRRKASDSIKNERAELNILYNKLKNASISTRERTASVNEWIKRYPEYANILNGENINLSKLESAYKVLSKEIYANAVARQYTDKIADLSVKREKEEIKRLNQKATLMKAQRRAEQAEAEKAAAQQAQRQGLYGSSNRLASAKDELSSANKDLEKQQKIYDDIVKNVESYDKNITTISDHIKTANLFPQPKEGTYDYWKQQQVLAEGALKEIKSEVKKTLDDASKEGKDLFSLGLDKSVVETYKKATAQVKEAKKQLEAYNGDNGKTSGGNDMTNYQTELADARVRAQQKLEAALVAVKQEGYEKRRELAKLEYQAELAEIDKREKKMTEKLDNARKNGKTVSPEEYKQVKENANIERSAALISYEGELDKINEDASSAERKKLEEYAKQFQGYITKRTFTEKGFDTKRDALQKDGASKETLAELDYQKNKALEDIDKEFAGREAAFQTWAANVVNLSLEELRRLLVEAEQELERQEFLHPDDKGLASRRAKVTTLKNAITEKTNNPGKGKDTKKSIKEWSDLNRVLGEVEDSFNDIGGTVGDVAGDIIKTAGTIATSTLQMISGIQKLSENSALAMTATSDAAAKSMSNVEKASVVLTIISAALQAVTAIAGLFKRTDYMEEFRREMEQLNYELSLTKLNAEISTDKNSIFGDDLWGNAIKNVNLAGEALNRYNANLERMTNRKKYTGFGAWAMEALGLKNTYDSLGDSIANMQLKVQHKTWFRSAKYQSLKDAVPELFKADGSVNQDALEKFIGTDTFGKLSRENQQYLQEMSDYWKSYQEAVEKVKEYLSDIFGDLGETLTDTLVDSWANGTDAAKDYYNSVSEMLEKLGTQMIYSTLFSDIFDKAQNKMLEVTQNSELTADQKFKEYIKLLGGMTDEVLGKKDDFNALLEAYQKMAKEKGFDLFQPDEDTASQSGRSGAFTSISQEQGTKLEGLFTSLQDHASGIHQLLEELKQGRYADHEIFVQIAENTAYCKLLEDILEIMQRQDRDGVKWK